MSTPKFPLLTKSPSCLDVVATPIGHLADLSPRAREVLDQADVLCAEDTRRTRSLLQALGIALGGRRLIAVHQHNERSQVEPIMEALNAGLRVALVSDAGTPGVSDPGVRLLADLWAAGFSARPIPGPSALIALVSVSGLTQPNDGGAFQFVGFLPSRRPARLEALKTARRRELPLVAFEAPHRIDDLLTDAIEIYSGKTLACHGRELTKEFETLRRGPLAELLQAHQAASAADARTGQGEHCLMIGVPQQALNDSVSTAAAGLATSDWTAEQWADRLTYLLPKPAASKLLAEAFGLDRETAYAILLKATNESRT